MPRQWSIVQKVEWEGWVVEKAERAGWTVEKPGKERSRNERLNFPSWREREISHSPFRDFERES